MPFLYDIDADDETLQRPILGVFAQVKDNLERLVLVNIGWSIQLFPALAALGFPQLPAIVRACLFLYSLLALVPASALLFVWMARVAQGEMLRLELLKEDLRALAFVGMFRVAVLFGFLGLSYVLILLAGLLDVLALDVLARFTLIVLLVCSLYWGPLFAAYPERSVFFLLRRSLLLVWRYPGATALTGLVVLLVTAFGVFTVVPFFVIVPVVITLLQTRRCLALLAREPGKFKVGVL